MTPEEYHDEQRKTLRPLAFIRLHENRFTSNESAFVTAEQWAACYCPELQALGEGDSRRVVFGADASTSRDHTALVGVHRNHVSHTADVVYCKTWKPVKGRLRAGKPTIDLDETIGKEVFRLHREKKLLAVYADPYQLHSLILKWQEAGIRVVEMPQTAARTEADQALYDAIINKTLRHYNHPDLNEHVRNAVAVETPRGFRLAKEKTSRFIDGAVALSQAHYGAMATGAYVPAINSPTQKSRWNIGHADPRESRQLGWQKKY
jgi:phage terminase large subunit-like protein